MSQSTTLFLKKGINLGLLTDYIKQKYDPNAELTLSNDHFGNISFKESSGNFRNMSVYLHIYDEGANLPVAPIVNQSISLSLGAKQSSIDIFEDIAKHFGGGYIQEDDCGDDTWYPVEPNEEVAIREDKRELALRKMLNEDKEDCQFSTLQGKFSTLQDIFVIRFILKHLDEIKKL